ncbi:MAG: cytochrome c family protein, partial [Acidobacteria bacterium]|nr:cytochrome c family protein [Acidobacteriota bacterium]
FWQYAGQLFGVDLPVGIGLTGNGLSGKLQPVGDHFEATGIPVLPYNDKMNWNPFQIATVTLRDGPERGKGTSQTIQVVLPVSDEIDCAQCHAQGMDGTVNLPAGGTEQCPGRERRRHVEVALAGDARLAQSGYGPGRDLLFLSSRGYDPMSENRNQRNGVPGDHSFLPDRTVPWRAGMGDPNRNPWVTEPTCEQCHGTNYSTGTTLYRQAKGHGGVYCEACHNSTHAWWPSKLWADDLQPAKLQRTPYAVGNCTICHTRRHAGDNPHAAIY